MESSPHGTPEYQNKIDKLLDVATNSLIKYLEQPTREPPRPITDSLKEIIGLITGVSAIIVASLWYFGRSYQKGYSYVTNIPLEQLNFSIWDYGEDAWGFLGLSVVCGLIISGFLLPFYNKRIVKGNRINEHRFRYTLLTAIVFSLGLFIFMSTQSIIIKIVLLFIGSLILYYILSIYPFSAANKRIRLRGVLLISSAALIFIVYLIMVGELSSIRGQARAKFFLSTASTKMRITTSNAPLGDISTTQAITVGQDLLFQYEPMYLLTYNDKRYYLIEGIGADCRPLKVHIVKEDNVRSAELLQADPIKCD